MTADENTLEVAQFKLNSALSATGPLTVQELTQQSIAASLLVLARNSVETVTSGEPIDPELVKRIVDPGRYRHDTN